MSDTLERHPFSGLIHSAGELLHRFDPQKESACEAHKSCVCVLSSLLSLPPKSHFQSTLSGRTDYILSKEFFLSLPTNI